MSDEIMVSVFCLAYNHEKYVEQCLESLVTQQTNFKFEILVHDDASTDKTADIIRKYERKYSDLIKPIYQTENQYSKRVGISAKFLHPAARGKYVAFCECDDFWIDPLKLQKQVDFLESHPEYIACVCRCMTVGEDGQRIEQQRFGNYEKPGVYTLADFPVDILPSQIGGLMYREIFLDPTKGYPESFTKIKAPGDVKSYLWLLAHGDIYRMDETMSAYRYVRVKGGNSWNSRRMADPRFYERWQAIRTLEKAFYREYGKKIRLKRSTKKLGFGVVQYFVGYRTLKNFLRALHVLLVERGVFSLAWKELIQHFKSK